MIKTKHVTDMTRCNSNSRPAQWAVVKQIFRSNQLTSGQRSVDKANMGNLIFTATEILKKKYLSLGTFSFGTTHLYPREVSGSPLLYRQESRKIWRCLLKRPMARELNLKLVSCSKPILLHVDNQGGRSLASNRTQQPRIKHLDISY